MSTTSDADEMDLEGGENSKVTEKTAKIAKKDNAPPPAAIKRKLYNADGNEITDVKRNRPKPVEGEKLSAIKCVLHWTVWGVHAFGIADATNIDVMNELASILNTAHNVHRQVANRSGGLDVKVPSEHVFTIGETGVTRADLFPVLKTIASAYGFNYGTTEADRKLLGTLSSLLSLLVAFKSRLAEVRTSTLEIVFGKEGGASKARRLDQFFLDDSHATLLTGMNYPPAIKSSQKGCLGPLALALQLAFTTEKKYQKTWKEGFCTAFKLFPGVTDYADLIAGSQFDNCTLIREMADIAFWGTTRTSNKMYPPLALLYAAACKNALFKANSVGTYIRTPMERIAENELSSAIRHIDFSGKGSFHLWNELTGLEFKMKKGKMTQRTGREILFHGTWGTHKEDLSLIQHMTGHTFQTRKDIKDQLQERGSSTETVVVTIIPFQKTGKLANAAQTDLLSGARGQIVRAPTFSVKSKQAVDLDGALYRTLTRGPAGGLNAGKSDQASLLARLASIKSAIATRIAKEKEVQWGTVKLHTYDASVVATGYGPEINEVPELKGIYFYGIPEAMTLPAI